MKNVERMDRFVNYFVAVIAACLIGLLCVMCSSARASEIAFSFSGMLEDTGTPFTASFDVDTLDPGNSLQDTFAGGVLQTISVGVIATNFNATLGGVPLAVNAPGSLSFVGHDCIGACNGAFWGPSLGISGGPLTLIDTPQFGVATASQSAIQGSSDPLGLLLSGSWYGSDDPGFLMVNGAMVSTDVEFVGTAVDPPASVPEPGLWALIVLGGLSLGAVWIGSRL